MGKATKLYPSPSPSLYQWPVSPYQYQGKSLGSGLAKMWKKCGFRDTRRRITKSRIFSKSAAPCKAGIISADMLFEAFIKTDDQSEVGVPDFQRVIEKTIFEPPNSSPSVLYRYDQAHELRERFQN